MFTKVTFSSLPLLVSKNLHLKQAAKYGEIEMRHSMSYCLHHISVRMFCGLIYEHYFYSKTN